MPKHCPLNVPWGQVTEEFFSLNVIMSKADHLLFRNTTEIKQHLVFKGDSRNFAFPIPSAHRDEGGRGGGSGSKGKGGRLTVAIAVVDPLLPVLGGGHGFLEPRLFHNGAGILPGPLLQRPRAFPDTAHHDHHKHQQQEKHDHPRQMLIDVKVLVWVLPGMAPLEAFDGRAGLLAPGGLHGRQQLQDVSVVGALLVVDYLEVWEGLVHTFLPLC